MADGSEAPLLEAMQDRAGGMSKNHRRVAQFVSGNYQTVAFSTISELAQLSGVSEATIVRFCKALDFPGYPAFQKEIRRLVRADLKGTDRFRLGSARRGPDDTPLREVVEKELENIEALQRNFHEGVFRRAQEIIREASKILVAGSRSTASLANHFWFGLGKLGFNAERVLAVGSETYDRVHRMASGSLLILIGYPRYLREQVELLDFAKRRGLRTLVLTDSPSSPLKGEVTLFAPAESASFIAFHCAPMILINALLREVSLADPEATLAALTHFETLAESRAYFEKPDLLT